MFERRPISKREPTRRGDLHTFGQTVQISEGEIQAIVREIQQYGIRVRLCPAVAGDRDLGRISGFTLEVVKDPFEPTIEAFTLCHMFGHMVQFTDLPKYKELLDSVSGIPPIHLSRGFWHEFYLYEREAFGYGAALLDNSIRPDDALRSRYANFMELDFEHFRHYITTNKRSSRAAFRAKLLRRYASFPASAAIAPLSFSSVKWANLSSTEARIY